jgi:drug/metabolite transporter (DMT)-like permease
MEYSRNQRLIGLARIALACLIWGSIPLVIRATDGASEVKVFARMFFAMLVVGGFMVATNRLGEITRLSRRKLIQVMGQGLLLTFNWFLFMTALEMTDVATAELLAYTGPVMVAALAPFITKEAFDRRIIAPLAVAMLGLLIILVPHGVGVTSQRELIGALLAFGSAITYATLLLRSKKILQGISTLAMMLVQYAIASVVLLPFVFAAYARGAGPTGTQSYVALIVLGVVHTAVSSFIFLGGLRRVRTDHAAVLTYTEPVSAVLLAALFLAEPLTTTTLAGGVMVIAGGIVVARLDSTDASDALPIEVTTAEPEAHEYAELERERELDS